jgi:mRNA interferase RelE/StbE
VEKLFAASAVVEISEAAKVRAAERLLTKKAPFHRERVALTASTEKELQGLPPKVVARMVPRLELLASTPRPPGFKKLKGGDKEWRIRVGDYRIVYEIDDTA